MLENGLIIETIAQYKNSFNHILLKLASLSKQIKII